MTIVAACRDRTAFLQTALSGWIAALPPNADLLLVDWGTTAPDHVPLAEVVRVQADPRVSVVTVSEPGPWVLSRAYNLAFSLARGEWILKLDCDTVLHKSFFELNPAPTTEDIYFRFFWENAKDDNEQHLNGVFMAKAAALARIHGYDERITTYGWDDSDLYKRLEAAYTASPTTTTTTLKPRQFDPKSLFHMTHGDDLRGANQKLVMGPTLETQVNSQALASLSSWTAVGDTQKTKYRLDILSRDAQFLLASTLQTPPPLLQQLSAQEKLDIVDEATNRVLHDIYGFPWSVLSEINRSRAELVRSLAALGRSTHWQSGNGFIFAEVGGTVPERILAMASAIALAMTYERPLFMAWNSGPRQDPRPRVTDFFDVEPPGVLDDPFKRGSEAKKLAHVFQIGRWKCRSVVDICAESDPAFKMMAEYRSGGHDDQTAAAQTILEVLKGSVPGKRNVMLRLEGPFPLQTVDERAKAFASLSPSQALAAEIARIGKKTDRLGLYLGRGVRSKGIEAMTKRLDDHNGKHTKYFISGAARDIVELARTSLRSTDASTEAADLAGSYGSSREIREVLRDIAELYALSSCEHMVNDGRPPSIALEVISLLRQKNV